MNNMDVKIIHLLENGPTTVQAIAHALGMTYQHARLCLSLLVEDGTVRRRRSIPMMRGDPRLVYELEPT